MPKLRYLPLLPVLLLTACSGQVTVPGTASKADVEELQQRVLDLQRQAAVTEVELRELRRQLSELSAGTASVAPAPAPAPMPAEESWEAPMSGSEIEASDLPPTRGEPSPAPAPSPSGDDDLMPLPPPSSEAQAVYDRGYTLYHQGRYAEAESAFQELLSTYRPNELSDNAWYWIGESRWGRGDVAGALAAFRQTVEAYPRGNKTPDALLKIGACLERQGDGGAAAEAYREVVARYPSTAAAAVAQEKLGGRR